MSRIDDIAPMITELPLEDLLVLRDCIHDAIIRTFTPHDGEHIKEMERRLAGYRDGTVPSEPADVSIAGIRRELAL